MLRRLDRSLFDDDAPGLDRFGVVLLATVATIVTLSLADLSSDDEVYAALAQVAVTLFAGVMFFVTTRATGIARRWRRLADVFIVLAMISAIALVVLRALSDGGASGVGELAPSPIWTVIIILMPVAVIRRIFQHSEVRLPTLLGAISAYLMLAVAFTYAFFMVEAFGDEPFFGQQEPTTSFMYFSVTTLSTLGYGDLTPVTPPGRLLATFEAVGGQIFLVTLVAALVGLYVQRGRRAR